MTQDPFQAIDVTSPADDDRKFEEMAKELLDTPSISHLTYANPTTYEKDRRLSSPRRGETIDSVDFLPATTPLPRVHAIFVKQKSGEGSVSSHLRI
ncbi:hypothetical protein N7G274_010567 [Stereocaulon virgatum]|uniref:Uncharacterized protein n=1 Tax=Stereocaulon virgatum TaxID=373712 RepID=A0ABR3ZVN2_9LECA